MYLLLYNNNATVFLNVFTCTYLPHKIASIVTFVDVPSFSAYVAMVFLYFMKTNNISGYLVTPLSWRHYMITIYRTNPSLPFYVTHFNIYCTSLAHHIHACKLPSKTVSQQMTYLHPFDPTYILYICPVFSEFQILSLSFLHLTPCVQTVFFTSHVSIHTNVLVRFFAFYSYKG